MTDLPQSGGSYTRDPKGKLKQTEAPVQERAPAKPAPKPAPKKEG